MINIEGTTSSDMLVGESESDSIFANEGEDKLFGGQGDDYLYGQQDNDKLFGQRGNDYMNGGSGDDILYGFTGNDIVVGGWGNDLINGAGLGQDDPTSPQSFGRGEVDTLTGGLGEDTFQLWGANGRSGISCYYNGAGSSDYALITDFNKSEDIIKLTAKAGYSSSVSSVSYSLGASLDGSSTEIYLNKSGDVPDLIAILENVAPESISLSDSCFSFS